ncbi:MAG: glycosyltransferase [Candidatus Baltobacteraceae bacterium]
MGVGHTSAANAMQEALESAYPDSRTRVVDSYKYAASVVSQVVSNGYLGMVKTIPQMYRFLYARAERATEVGPFRAWVHQFTAGNLRALIEKERPDVVVCTHAFPCGVMAEYRRHFADAPPVVGVVTDFAVHAYWIHDNVAAYAVATPEMKNAMAARGIEADRIFVTGIPIKPQFGELQFDREALRARLDLPLDRAVILLMGGGLGIGPLGRMLSALDAVDQPLCAVAIVGRSVRSEERVLERATRIGYPVRVLRFVDNVYDYMHAADLLVSKPGGLTASEALAANLPLVLFKPLPGQEERNTRYLMQRGAAVRAKNRDGLSQTVAALLEDRTRIAGMRKAIGEIAKPDAAARAATIIATVAREARGAAVS